MDLSLLNNLKTEPVHNKDQILQAANLSKNYNFIPTYQKDITKLINQDWWSQVELLTDVIKIGRQGFEERQPIGFILLTECNIRNKSNSPLTDLYVGCFALDPWYDIEVGAKWADYRIHTAASYLSRIDRIIWPVDEYNVPLQIQLREIGYHVADYHKSKESFIFIK